MTRGGYQEQGSAQGCQHLGPAQGGGGGMTRGGYQEQGSAVHRRMSRREDVRHVRGGCTRQGGKHLRCHSIFKLAPSASLHLEGRVRVAKPVMRCFLDDECSNLHSLKLPP